MTEQDFESMYYCIM